MHDITNIINREKSVSELTKELDILHNKQISLESKLLHRINNSLKDVESNKLLQEVNQVTKDIYTLLLEINQLEVENKE